MARQLVATHTAALGQGAAEAAQAAVRLQDDLAALDIRLPEPVEVAIGVRARGG